MSTALEAGLAGCSTCGLVSRLAIAPAARTLCPRCASELHARKPQSLARTWFFLLTALVLYVPANVLPVMETQALGDVQLDTILSGIVFLWITGSWAIAIIVFIASIVVPVAKLAALAALAVSVQTRSRWKPRQRARLYRMLEIVGKWSMLDIYVVALLGTLVNFSALMSVRAGIGALAFAAVVIFTLLAAQSFDPRLIWDTAEKTDSTDS